MSNDWYNIPKQTKINAYTQISEETGMAPFAIEKDWWVVQVLAAIFELKVSKHLLFKGGTSLSKAWGLIERFSEDVDLALDRDFLGYTGEVTRSQIKKLRKETGRLFEEVITAELETRLKERGLVNITANYVRQEASDADPVKVEVYYPEVIEYPAYVQPRVILEISSSSLKESYEIRTFYSLLDEHYLESEFAEGPIEIPVAIPERTFLEKLFLLHEEFHRPHQKIRVDRLSRHLYDVFQLIKSDHAIRAINNQDLYTSIVKHRQTFHHMGGIDYNLHQPQTLNPVPIPEFMDAWEADYRTMQEEMIYGDAPSFKTMIDTIKEFTVNEINQLDWKMDFVIPKP